MSRQTISVNEWIQELSRLQSRSGSGYTSNELAKAWGVSIALTRRRLRLLKDAGRLRCSVRRIEGVDGSARQAPCYELIGAVKRQGKRDRGR